MLSGTIAFWICGLVNLPFCGASGLVYWSLAGSALAAKNLPVLDKKEAYQNRDNADKINDIVMQSETCD